MEDKTRHITRKVVWGYLLLLLIAICSVYYVYTIIQQLAVEEKPDTLNREKAYLVTNTLSLIYESEALGQLVGRPGNDLRNFNRTMRKAHQNLDSLRVLLTDSVQQLKVDTIQNLLKQRRWNTLRLLETLNEWNAGRLYVENIERVIAIQDSVIRHHKPDSIVPTVREIIEVQQDTVIVPKKKKGFFQRLADAFSPDRRTEDTSFVVNTTRKLVTDTIRVDYNPSDTIVSILRNLQDTVAGQRKQLSDVLLQRASNLRYNNTMVTSRINQMLRAIEEEEMEESFARVQHKQSILRQTTRTIASVGLVAILVAIVFLIIIIRDISRSYYYRRQLEKAKQYAEDLLQSREKLILTISHDIRAPLSSIIGYIELLLRRNPDERQRYYLDNMTGSSQHILSLVNDLLDYHRLESGQMEIHPVPFSVAALMQEIYDSFRPLAEAKSLQLTLDLKPEFADLTYLGDTIRLRQVVNNLLSNAIKFTPEGNVTLRVAIQQKGERMYELDVTVSDAGPGIPESEQERIFGDFTRLASSNKVEGFGLGLSITRRLVDLLKGTLNVHSVVGQGSDFILTLPMPLSDRTESKLPQAEEPTATEVALPADRTVYCLLVDDDAIQLALTEELLKRSHVEVVGVSNPHKVLDILRNTRFDAVITDIQMPGVDGYHLLRMIRESGIPDADKVPVIALSASVANEHSHYIEAGFTGFLNKPFTAEQLIALLNKLLALHLEPVVKIDFSSLTAFAGEDTEASASILRTFTEETSKSIQLLQDALDSEKRTESSRLAHKLIPLLTMLGANNLVQKLRILEKNDDELTDAGWRILLTDVIEHVSDIVRQARAKCE